MRLPWGKMGGNLELELNEDKPRLRFLWEYWSALKIPL